MQGAKKIVVGMSGGVDSSVTASLLKSQGHEVYGLFMRNWNETDDSGHCTQEKDFADVAKVCERIGIPYYSVDFSQEYWDQVFKDFLQQYERGYTPNPDILCNREIKFKAFFDHAMKLGADYVATGHYCQVSSEADEFQLIKGLDGSKDQSYFLHAINPQVLNRVLFPIGHLLKKDLRKLALDINLPTAVKKDSTGICFIGERKFRPFLQQYLTAMPGPFIDYETGQSVGEHQGQQFYTLGQRKGLGLGGAGEPWFVVAKDQAKNLVMVVRGQDHPILYRQELTLQEVNWLTTAPPSFPFSCSAKIRYRQDDQACTVDFSGDLSGDLSDGSIRVRFVRPQRAVTPGQYCVFYQGNHCLGGGPIA